MEELSSLNATVNDKMPLERVLVDDSLHPETFAASQEKQVQVRILMSLLDELSMLIRHFSK